MSEPKQYVSSTDCCADKLLDKVACKLKGPKWEQIRAIQRADVYDYDERCVRCDVRRMNAGGMAP